MTTPTHSTCSTRHLCMGALAVLLSLAACAPPTGTVPPSATHDMLEGKVDGGFVFQRGLWPDELTFDQADQAFDPGQYLAYWFQSSPGPVEITTWRDYLIKVGANPLMTQVLFEWNPKGGSDDMSDGNNWSLLRENSGRDSWPWNSGDVDTIANLPDDNRYLLVVLGVDGLYEMGAMTHTQMTALPPGDSTPGGLQITATDSVFGSHVVGLEVSVGTLTAATDDTGTVTFYNLAPNTYTVKLGPGGDVHEDMTVQPGTLSSRTIEIDLPLGSPPPAGGSSPSGGGGGGCDPAGGSSRNAAATLSGEARIDAQICSGDDDWYEVQADGQWTATIDFDTSVGDLDMEAVDLAGNPISVSDGSGNEESVTETGPFYVHVYGFSGASNRYTLTVSAASDGGAAASSDTGSGDTGSAPDRCAPSGNDTMYVATPVESGASIDAQICSGDADWYEVDADGEHTVTIDFDDSAGDLDMEAIDVEGNQLDLSNGSGDEESVTETGPFYVHVYGYDGATNTYTLTVD